MKRILLLTLVAMLSVFCFAVYAADGANTFQLVWTDPLVDPAGGPDGNDRCEDSLAGVDLDGDGKGEVLALVRHNTYDGGHLLIYEAQGDDNYQLVWDYRGLPSTNGIDNPNAIDVGDLDQNGRMEIYLAVSATTDSDPTLYVFEYTGTDNNYGSAPIYTRTMAAEYDNLTEVVYDDDLDGDGDPELIITNTHDNDAIFILSVTAGEFSGTPTITEEFSEDWETAAKGSPFAVAVADTDGDSNKEIIIVKWDNLTLRMYEATGADAYSTANEIELSTADDYDFHGIAVADIDDDGKDEVYFNNYSAGGEPVYCLSPSGDVLSATTADVYTFYNGSEEWVSFAIGDQDHAVGNSDELDLYMCGANGNLADWEYNGSGAPTSSANFTRYDLPTGTSNYLWNVRCQAGFDMDGDGAQEIVATAQDSDGTRSGGLGTPKDDHVIYVYEWVDITSADGAWQLYY